MAIKVTRNDAGNCITFVGSTNPVYWNSCLEGEINENNSNNVNVINKIRTVEEGTTIYEFFNLPYTDFQDKDGNDFVSPSDCAEYITANANVLSNTGTFIFSQTDVIDAQRDATDTTVLFSNGDIFAVNSLTASAVADGTIKISTVRGGKDIYTHIRYYNVSVLNGGVIGFNTIEAAVDRLNEVLGGTTVGSNTGNTSTTVTTTSNSSDFTVYGSRITETGSGTTLGYTSTAQAGNFDTSNGLYSNQTISKNGEYFEFEQASGDWTNSRGVYIGLFDETTYNVEDLNVDSAGNAVKGLLYLRLYPTPFTFADATNGAGKINEVGFSNSPQTKTKFRLGRDNDGRVYIAHETSPNVFEVICRSESVIATDTELRFFSIMPRDNQLNGIRNMTVNNAVLAASFIWYYIESPDTEFYYPLFSSQADAKTVDELYGTAASGSGLSHPHTFADEQPSVQTWYMPASYMTHAGASAPTTPIGIAWNEIQTGDDASYIPSQFTNSMNVSEGDNINFQIKPLGDPNTYSISNIPVGLAYNSISGYLQGTAPEVTGDNIANPSDVYSITVTKVNSYGSSVGTLTINVANLTVPAVSVTGIGYEGPATPTGTSVNADNWYSINEPLSAGERFVIPGTVIQDLFNAMDQNYSSTILFGIKDTSWVNTIDGNHTGGTIPSQGFEKDLVVRLQKNNYASAELRVLYNYMTQGAAISFSNSTGGSNLSAFIEISTAGDQIRVGITANTAADSTATTTYSDWSGGKGDAEISPMRDGTSREIMVFWDKGQTSTGFDADDIDWTNLTEQTIPVAPTNTTDWTNAIDFNGGSEHLKQQAATQASPFLLNGTTVDAASTGMTTSDSNGRPWATTVVFRLDGANADQHIWNYGEGVSNGDDNIYLRVNGSRQIYFGWGRETGNVNECYLGMYTANKWYGMYIAHNGTRLLGSSASGAALAACFSIRHMSETLSFGTLYSEKSTSSNWISGTTGNRMDRSLSGNMCIGGSDSNRNFSGKIASMVATTLKVNQTMPTDAEIILMITDPRKWMADHKVGESYRYPWSSTTVSNWQMNSVYPSWATQVWLMGEGPTDTFNNGIRNQASYGDFSTKMTFMNMQANDIETVNITGLTS